MKKFPLIKQSSSSDCGAACIAMVSKFYGKKISLNYLNSLSSSDQEGSTLFSLTNLASKIGLEALGVRIDIMELIEKKPFPCIAHWNGNHYVVVFRIKKLIYVADPAKGLLKYTTEKFCDHWYHSSKDLNKEGIILLLKPKASFYAEHEDQEKPSSLLSLIKYLIPYKKLIFQLFLGLLTGSLISLMLPFLTQSIVDIGINSGDLNYILLLLVAQIMLFVGSSSVNVIRAFIILHISSRLNISIISFFLERLMKLPISFFESKNVGDVLQRIREHNRIKSFLTNASLEIVFSLITFFIYSLVLVYYSISIFTIFIFGSSFYIIWVLLFLKKRKEIDQQSFGQSSENTSQEVEIIQGMQEIKLANCEQKKRREWENVQIRKFRLEIKRLSIEQLQSSGGGLINQIKNALMTFWTVNEVINGSMTLGMMMAVQQILGQISAPINQFASFIQRYQDAKISLERLNEINYHPTEDEKTQVMTKIPKQDNITFQNVTFKYGGNESLVLDNLNLSIQRGKTTAIVGVSGSGKTTLLKLLLKFYNPIGGNINIGSVNLKNIDSNTWRSRCGVVMQDGFIFSDTIAYNIALADEEIDMEKLEEAVSIANIKNFIEGLPNNYNSMIGGKQGIGLSQGQKQRILIARAVYKQPELIFFDEATSALDTQNEREITKNLLKYGKGKTLLIIAHRLSTVKTADNIIVLEKGQVKEMGIHEDLIKNEGVYWSLVKSQISL